jgi:hypothetical protein
MQHTLMATAPAGTTKIRVKAAALDMVASCTDLCTAGQDVYFDNFSLRDNVVTNLERLTNGNLDTPGAPTSWSLVKTPEDNVQFSTADYARHGGAVGMWLRAFNGGSAKVLQTVAGTAGTNYTLSGWSKWETGYGSGNPFPPAGQPRTFTFMRMEFLDGSSTVIGTQTLDLCQDPGVTGCTVQQNDGTWRQFSFNAAAPLGTASVRVSAGADNMYNTGVNPQSAMFDDFSLTIPGSGSGNLLTGALAAVPEPTTICLLLIGLAAGLGICRRRAF